MEPAKEQIRLLWVVYTTVVGLKAFGTEPDVGWYVHFDGSRESIFFGKEKPNIEVGDKFKITFEKVQT